MRLTLLIAPAVLGLTLGASSTAFAANPPGPPGPPNQSCQALEPNTPGHASGSPGSPFNEPGSNSVSGGVGGQHYSVHSQYDVACYQASKH